MSKPDITGTSEGGGGGESWDGEMRETKAEADGEDMGERLEKASAPMSSGPGT